jgi:hypothetical protein
MMPLEKREYQVPPLLVPQPRKPEMTDDAVWLRMKLNAWCAATGAQPQGREGMK